MTVERTYDGGWEELWGEWIGLEVDGVEVWILLRENEDEEERAGARALVERLEDVLG